MQENRLKQPTPSLIDHPQIIDNPTPPPSHPLPRTQRPRPHRTPAPLSLSTVSASSSSTPGSTQSLHAAYIPTTNACPSGDDPPCTLQSYGSTTGASHISGEKCSCPAPTYAFGVETAYEEVLVEVAEEEEEEEEDDEGACGLRCTVSASHSTLVSDVLYYRLPRSHALKIANQ